ncbi:MAG: ABC transporter permease [Aigarchaeota archaeon]|nr:ABC transporter permease [Aigarchaeota archaeon]MCX8193409.1 ABC transporter permease [Nitrososphaeria archaeon]MDW7985939.1 ABC transporter permease [Nitrososphaerota archaeon]
MGVRLVVQGLFKNIIKTRKMGLKFKAGATIFFVIMIFGLLSFLTPHYHSYWYHFPQAHPPSLQSVDFIFGTTSNGRSVFWSLTNAIVNSLIIAVVTSMLACHIGLIIGILSGIKGGVIDKIMMFLTDSFIAIPGLPLTIMLAMILKPIINLFLLGVIISIISWPWSARMIRAITLSLREKDFVIFAKFSGMSTWKIIFSEIFPHILGFHATNIINTMLGAIGAEVGLAFLGLSIIEMDTLGTMIYWIQRYGAILQNMWWWVVPPIATLILLFLSLYLVSTGIQEFLNPRLRRVK